MPTMPTVRVPDSGDPLTTGQACLKRIMELEALWRTSQRWSEAAHVSQSAESFERVETTVNTGQPAPITNSPCR
jgi:hypothetical protein